MRRRALGLSLVLFVFFVAFVGVSQDASALQITVTDALSNRVFGTQTFDGGPFYFDPTPVAGPSDKFLTFCVELDEHLSFGSTYYATIDSAAIEGGVAGGNPDPLDIKTDYLFYQFSLNSAAYDDAHRIGLQLAIWKLEDEIVDYSAYSYLDPAILGYANAYYLTVVPAGYDSSVVVVNLYSYKDGELVFNQSGLKVPEPGTLMLLGVALVGLFGVKRRRG